MKAIAILFGIVGIILLLVFGLGAQTARGSGGWDPYPGPESPGLILYAGGLHLFSTDELTGTLPLVLVIDGVRFERKGRILNKQYQDGWQLYIDILPPGF